MICDRSTKLQLHDSIAKYGINLTINESKYKIGNM